MAGHSFSLPAGRESAAHHRHEASLEGILDFSGPSLSATEQAQAQAVINALLNHCEPLQSSQPYKKVTLVRLTYAQCRSVDLFLQQFFTYFDTYYSSGNTAIQPSFERGLARCAGFSSQSPAAQKQEAESVMNSFAEYLFNNFFLPMKAAGSKTPQASAASLSVPAIDNVVGTPARLSVLRRDCLIRDHHRCVVTRQFDVTEAIKRGDRDSEPKDDDDRQLTGPLAQLQVAHIIPHSIMSSKTVDGEPELSASKKTALSILNMFDPGVIHLLEGSNIDRPSNAISLAADLHTCFGLFKLTFEAVDSSTDHTYTINSSNAVVRSSYNLPVTRALLISPHHTIDPPSVKLLALHRAIARILELSAAGTYIDRIIRNMEEVWVRSDGSAELGRIVGLKLGGWLDGVTA
ncbi:hypothetical protein ACJ73_05502 [Blastomyces percursus]|uniref:HNH nuclease domain-containing protein n=1 Tax=Blastomyces percursus TaxID=1658174 RepID=A0A1J9Q3D1_9EURO|nr:hypothetical protein ACJ73_05502 [Blastomyces percursus]